MTEDHPVAVSEAEQENPEAAPDEALLRALIDRGIYVFGSPMPSPVGDMERHP